MQLTTTQPARHPNPTAKASALAYLIFDRPDLDLAERYLADFGLRTASRSTDMLFMRGTGPAPYCYVVRKAAKAGFVGLGLRFENPADLERLALVPGASPGRAVTWPGGGQRVTLTDPSGFEVHAITGQSLAQPLPRRSALPLNSADAGPRVNQTQRP